MTLQYAGRHRTKSPFDLDSYSEPPVTASNVAAVTSQGDLFIAFADAATGNMLVARFDADGVDVIREASRLPVPTCATWADVQIEAS